MIHGYLSSIRVISGTKRTLLVFMQRCRLLTAVLPELPSLGSAVFKGVQDQRLTMRHLSAGPISRRGWHADAL